MAQQVRRTATQHEQADHGVCSGNGTLGPGSRRSVFAPHAFDPSVMRRCPICQWAVEQDHAEALRLNSLPPPSTVWPDVSVGDELDQLESLAVVGFALV